MKILLLSLALVVSTVLAAPDATNKSAGLNALKAALEAQITMSEYGAKNAESEKVRVFAARVNTEYTAFAADLEKIAPGEAVQKVKKGGKENKYRLVLKQLLETGKVESFTDRKYLAFYGKLHTSLLTRVRSSLNTLENPEAKALLEKELPVLEKQTADLKAVMMGKKKK